MVLQMKGNYIGGRRVEELREKLYEYIETYGFTDERTVLLSQALDVPVTDEHKKLNNIA